jgi:S1-C subfamily serine protease
LRSKFYVANHTRTGLVSLVSPVLSRARAQCLCIRRSELDPTTTDSTPAPVASTQVEQLRQSILNVRVTQCAQNGERVGTGFVAKAGYVATAAHILGDEQNCNGKIRLIDSKGREHSAALDGLSVQDDLALLRISDTSLPALRFADSAAYETPREILRLVTIGYPLEQAGASTQDSAAISNEGSLSHFDREHNVFVTSGLNLNSGNSGGPIFLSKNWLVLGVVRAKLSSEAGEGIGYIAPIKTFENFFREKTGQELR